MAGAVRSPLYIPERRENSLHDLWLLGGGDVLEGLGIGHRPGRGGARALGGAMGRGGPVTRPTGASRKSNACSCTSAAMFAPTPPCGQPSSTMTQRLV